MNKFPCPACGFNLGFQPWRDDSASHETCPSCGIEFGYHDVKEASGALGTKEEIYSHWRTKWIKEGMLWSGTQASKPDSRNPIEQLKNIGVDVDNIATKKINIDYK